LAGKMRYNSYIDYFSISAPLGRKLVGMYRSRYNRLEENAEETNADNVQEEPQQNGQQ